MYNQNGLGFTHPSGMWFSTAELLPNTTTILIFNKDKIVASLSTLLDSEFGLPVDDVFREEVDYRRKIGYKLAEIYSLGVNVGVHESKIILAKLFNFISIINYNIYNATQTLITVMPRHAKFYKEKLLFEEYGQLGFHKKTGVRCKLLAHNHSNSIQVNASYRSKTFFDYFVSDDESKAIAEMLKKIIVPISSDEFKYFYNIKPEITDSSTPEQKKYIEYMMKGCML
jgi:hypothetical protein